MHDMVLGRTLVRPRKGERKRAYCWGGDHDGSHPQLPKNTEVQVLPREACKEACFDTSSPQRHSI